MKNDTPAILSAAVDRLAVIKATIAELKTEENNLKQSLIDSGAAIVDGTLHRAAVSYCDGRTSIDWQSIAAKFNPSRQLITAHTSTGDPFYSVRVSARKGA